MPAMMAAISSWLGPLDWEIVLRLLVASMMGAAVGWEREHRGRPAGLRTHMLLCVGCALVMLVSLRMMALAADYGPDAAARADPGRIAAGALSGLGFLGAGAIIVFGRHIYGLTTAASIWVTAAIGLAVGCGYVLVAFCAFVAVVFALWVVARWEQRFTTKDLYVRLQLRFSGSARRIPSIRHALDSHGLALISYTVDWDADGETYVVEASHSRDTDFESLTAQLVQELRPMGLSQARWD